MAFKDILLHLDQSSSCAARLSLAMSLAADHDAHVTGLYTAVAPQWPVELHSHMAGELLERQRGEATEAGQAVLADFTRRALADGLSVEGRVETCLETDLAASLAREAQCADLLVLGQAQPEEPFATSPQQVESVLLASGSPTLLVPYAGYATAPGGRIVVAWDGSREAARAVNDALPFLTAATNVMVLIVDPKSKAGRLGDEPGADIARHLARHDCRVELQSVESGSRSVGGTILARLSDSGADLLVMGAYGHSRLRELVLGGVTRHILAHMTVPVLMSH